MIVGLWAALGHTLLRETVVEKAQLCLQVVGQCMRTWGMVIRKCVGSGSLLGMFNTWLVRRHMHGGGTTRPRDCEYIVNCLPLPCGRSGLQVGPEALTLSTLSDAAGITKRQSAAIYEALAKAHVVSWACLK